MRNTLAQIKYFIFLWVANMHLAQFHLCDFLTICDGFDNLLVVEIVPETVTCHDNQVAVLNFVLKLLSIVRQFVIGAALVRSIKAPLLDWSVECNLSVVVDYVATVSQVQSLYRCLVFVDDH